jgi:MFS family permease
MSLLPDIEPLRRHRDFRLLYTGQFVSQFGSMLSHVALPYALYQVTRSPRLLGLLGVIQLVPSVIGGLFGGALADAVDRRRLILLCEAGMALCTLLLAGIAHTAASSRRRSCSAPRRSWRSSTASTGRRWRR